MASTTGFDDDLHMDLGFQIQIQIGKPQSDFLINVFQLNILIFDFPCEL